MVRGVEVGGDYLRLAIIFNISIYAGGEIYSREAITGGTAIIRGNTVYGYAPINREYCLFLYNYGTWYKNHPLALEVGDISLHLDRLIFRLKSPIILNRPFNTFFFNF